MSDMDFWELLYTTAPLLPDQDAVSKLFENARMLDANAIFDKIMSIDKISANIDIVRAVTDDLDDETISDIVLDFIIDIYPGVTKEIEREEKDAKLLMDVIGLCVKEITCSQ